jgi:hypothetical protein
MQRRRIERVVIRPSISTVAYFDLALTEITDGKETATACDFLCHYYAVDIRSMPNSPFGVMTHFAQYNDQRLLLILARAGIVHFRDEQYWNAIETEKDVFSYPAVFSGCMAQAAASSMIPLIPLTWSNRFYEFDNGTFTGP